jgi:hypothetical protein
LLALVVRLVIYNGAFGSDDLTYFQRAAELARGEWTSANYNGALRYGFNLPVAGFIALFGESLFVANLWPLACSLIEISAVYIFASAPSQRPRKVAPVSFSISGMVNTYARIFSSCDGNLTRQHDQFDQH